MIENGTLLQNRYLIEEQIGAGGMGAVYRAVDQRFGSYVAIKETFYKDDELGVAFEREARLLNSLQHPVLPHVSDYFAENNGYFLVMQFIEGEDLSDILKREGAFSAADLVRWANSLLDALDYLHSQNPPIIHRDIKPHNLKLTTRGDIILLDFGLAKLSSGETTGAISVFGYSRTYSPLEQIQGTGTDARSDIFALGATAYHLLAGKSAVDALARAASIVAGKPDPLRLISEIKPEIPVGVANVINSALALNPEQRFVSAKAMQQALMHAVKEIVSEVPIVAASENADSVAAPIIPVIHSAESDHFPALEAFAEAVKAPENETLPVAQTSEIVPVIRSVSSAEPHSANVKHLSKDAQPELPTQVSSIRKNKSYFPAMIAASVLISALAIFYFVAGTNQNGDKAQEANVETAPEVELAAEEKPPVSISPTPILLEAVSQVKNKPAETDAPADKRKEIADSTVESAKQETKSPVVQAPTTATAAAAPPVKSPRRVPAQTAGESRTRVVEQTQIADIESIFTGQRPSDEESDRREQRGDRRNRNNQISDEERELRRERRERRRERQNRRQFPPF